jgi:mRNA interferase RelE/StbE
VNYQILWPDSQRRALAKLPRDVQLRIEAKIGALTNNPRPSGCVKLAGHANLYRIRVGDYRIVYQIEDDRLIIIIVTVAHRHDVYRGL